MVCGGCDAIAVTSCKGFPLPHSGGAARKWAFDPRPVHAQKNHEACKGILIAPLKPPRFPSARDSHSQPLHSTDCNKCRLRAQDSRRGWQANMSFTCASSQPRDGRSSACLVLTTLNSNNSIHFLRLLAIPTNRGICFSLKDNSIGLKMALSLRGLRHRRRQPRTHTIRLRPTLAKLFGAADDVIDYLM